MRTWGFSSYLTAKFTHAWYLQFLNCSRVLKVKPKQFSMVSPSSSQFQRRGAVFMDILQLLRIIVSFSVVLPFLSKVFKLLLNQFVMAQPGVPFHIPTVSNTPDKNSNISLFSLISTTTGHCFTDSQDTTLANTQDHQIQFLACMKVLILCFTPPLHLALSL